MSALLTIGPQSGVALRLPFGSPAIRIRPDPWLCVPASRLVCLYRRRVRGICLGEQKARLMPKNAKGSEPYLETFNPIQGMTSNFTDASSELSIQIRSTTVNTFVELQSELIATAAQPVFVLSSRGNQLGWEIRCKIRRARKRPCPSIFRAVPPE
jgi:hypothetical protein